MVLLGTIVWCRLFHVLCCTVFEHLWKTEGLCWMGLKQNTACVCTTIELEPF